MTDRSEPPPPGRRSQEGRERRQAAALRENLRRRKQQSRARLQAASAPGEIAASPASASPRGDGPEPCPSADSGEFP